MTSELQVVTFGLGAEVFAVPVALVREILDWRETFHIPNGPAWLLGLLSELIPAEAAAPVTSPSS